MGSRRFNPDVYQDYEGLQRMVVAALAKMIRSTKGTMLTFNAKKIAVMAGLPTHPVVLTLIKEVIEQMRARGLVRRISRSSHGVKYAITRDSPFWLLAKAGEKTPMLEVIARD
ncbi:MAG: hypothetical protein DRJ96_01510 [Thermoprotei archaeon]|nr:MAG: hypothetical protein DRJ67_00905 [Thermoprotei archaeon]RLE98303.1 MAG: hypothetical protein DRJ96_01510 [Thermoprotei archaeon]RLF00914.1 MAG: hypothetical protein DRJ57_00150 [Thermoprotei archaeon]